MWSLQAAIHKGAKAAIQASGLIDSGRSRDVNMVAEMVAYGDSGAFLDKARGVSMAAMCVWCVCCQDMLQAAGKSQRAAPAPA